MPTFMENKHPQDWANLVFAILLFISPWVFGFSADRLVAGNAWICGVIIAALAIGALSAFQEWEEWLSGLVGIWVVVSPWVLGFAAMTNVRWTNVVLGVLVVIAAAWEIWEVRHRPHAA